MIDPNDCKFVTVDIVEGVDCFGQKKLVGYYRGQKLEVRQRTKRVIKLGRRRLYLKYCTAAELFYLSDYCIRF